MIRKPNKRLVDELPDVEVPPPGYGQRELAVIEKLFRPDLPDGELINLYFLVHDWHMGAVDVFGAWFKEIEGALLSRMASTDPCYEAVEQFPGFEPEAYREATEAVCSGQMTDRQLLEMYAVAAAERGDETIGHRWQAIMDLCRNQILRRIKATRRRFTYAGDETMPHPGYTPAEIEARHAANEDYGERIGSYRRELRMYESSVADAICLTEADIKRAEAGDPIIDPRMILAPLLLAADYYGLNDDRDHRTSQTYVAHFYEAAKRMTPKVREIWLLHHADGMPIGEIAEWQNLSTSLISQRIREAERSVELFGPQPPKPPKHKRRGPKR